MILAEQESFALGAPHFLAREVVADFELPTALMIGTQELKH